MSQTWERVRVIHEIILEAIGSDEVNTDPGAAIDRALTWAHNTDDPDYEIRLILGGLGHFAANVLTEALGSADEARARLQTRVTIDNVQEIYEDLDTDGDR